MNIQAGTPSSANHSGCLKLLGFGCLGFIVFLVIGAGVIYFMYKDITSWMVMDRTDAFLNQSAMPETHKEAIRDQVQRMMDAFQDEDLGEEEMQRFAESVQNNPIYAGFATIIIVADVAPKAGFDQAQTDELQKQFNRLTKGMQDHAVSAEDISLIIEPLLSKDENDGAVIRTDITTQELLDVSAAAKTCADDHQVPDEDFPYDFNAELKKLIDVTLTDPGL